MEAFTFNTAELILLSAAGILFIIQLIYYFGLYNRIHVRNKSCTQRGNPLLTGIASTFRHTLCTQ